MQRNFITGSRRNYKQFQIYGGASESKKIYIQIFSHATKPNLSYTTHRETYTYCSYMERHTVSVCTFWMGCNMHTYGLCQKRWQDERQHQPREQQQKKIIHRPYRCRFSLVSKSKASFNSDDMVYVKLGCVCVHGTRCTGPQQPLGLLTHTCSHSVSVFSFSF